MQKSCKKILLKKENIIFIKTKQRLFAICPVYTLGFLPDLIKKKKLLKIQFKDNSDAACALGAKFKKINWPNLMIQFATLLMEINLYCWWGWGHIFK